MRINKLSSLAAVFTAVASAASYGAHIRFKEFPIPLPASDPKPYGITTGPDGALWFAEAGADRGIGSVSTSGTFTQFLFSQDSRLRPLAIVTGPDGALWFTDAAGIGRITTGGSLSQYASAEASSIITGPDGALWFAEGEANEIGRMTTSGALTQYGVPTPSGDPQSIAMGADGALWFTENTGNKIGRITTGGGVINEYPLTGTYYPGQIAAGPDGALWFTEAEGVIGRITTTGEITQYHSHGYISEGGQITAGPDGALWFTVPVGHAVGRITTSGTITMYTVPSSAVQPMGITAGPDGNIWIAEDNDSASADLIARIPACGLGLRATFSSGTLSVAFDMGINKPATWTLDAGSGYGFTKRIKSSTSPRQFTFTYKNYPNVGKLRVESKLTDEAGRTYCSEYAYVNTAK